MAWPCGRLFEHVSHAGGDDGQRFYSTRIPPPKFPRMANLLRDAELRWMGA
jgi:hypothetical protein